jgi:hypothetical protein
MWVNTPYARSGPLVTLLVFVRSFVRQLATLMGNGDYRALFSRSLAQASASVP